MFINDDGIRSALIRCATGLSAEEVVEEFTADGDGGLRLVKKKVTKREIPPDIKAVKLLMDGRGEVSDAELEEERANLIKLLNVKGELDNE